MFSNHLANWACQILACHEAALPRVDLYSESMLPDVRPRNTSVKRAASADISAAAFAEYDVVMVDPPRVGL